MSTIYFDLETQNMSYEVGGWANLEAVGLAVGVTWDEQYKFRTWWESQVVELIQVLASADLIVGFNVNRFDYRVLVGYSDLAQYLDEQTFDLLLEMELQGMPKTGLDSIARRNLGASKMYKSADAVTLWREGRLEQLEKYCQQDVDLLRLLTEKWEKEGFLWLSDYQYVIWPGLRPTSLAAAGVSGLYDESKV